MGTLALATAAHALLGPSRALADTPSPSSATLAPMAAPSAPSGPPGSVPARVPVTMTVPPSEETDYKTVRYEPAGFPLIGGNSDVGFQFGAVGTLTRFQDDQHPYAWNMDLLLTASVKSGPNGAEIAQQSYLWDWDLIGLLGGKVRLNPLVAYSRTVDQGYFSPGNASVDTRPPGASEVGRYFEYIYTETRARQLVRVAVGGPYQVAIAGSFRAVSPTTYDGSQLAHDVTTPGPDGSPLVRGVERLGLAGLATGIIYDTRDNEIFPHSGAFHQIGVKYVQGLPTDANIRYGEASMGLVWYARLGQNAVFAGRAFVDLEFGNVPFYDLYKAGAFATYDMPGGASGIRGVPSGRYLGPIKAIANAELRALPIPLKLLGQKFRLGGDAFVDAGRIWSDYSFASSLDGTGLGIKYGVGLGAYLLWGQAALFRVEVAYSPDAAAGDPGSLPLGIYVEDGTMF